MYETQWAGPPSPSWEHERDLQHYRLHIIRLVRHPFAAPPDNPLFRQMSILAAHRELSRSRGEVVLASGYSLVPRTLWLHRFSSSTLPAGEDLWYKARHGLWWFGKIAHRTSTGSSSTDFYIVCFLDAPGPIKIDFLPSFYTTSRSAVQQSWYLQRHQAGGLARGLL